MDDYNEIIRKQQKVYLMLNNMPTIPKILIFEYSKTLFISSDFTEIKKANNNTPNNQPINESNYLEIEINRIGF
jgi:hypothetical protein